MVEHADADGSRAVAEAIVARLGRGSRVEPFPGGSVPVYGVGSDLVLKLYPPQDSEHATVEAAALQLLAGKLAVPTPRLEATGQLHDHRYVLMTRLRGELLSDVWDRVPSPDRARLAAQLGESLAALHAVDASAASALHVDWPAFVAEQRSRCVERQRGLGLAPGWLDAVDAFLDGPGRVDGAGRLVPLHTEVMREHLFAAPGPEGWELTGLFDFEPAMVGDAGYELASVGLFVTCGEPGLLRTLLLSYGIGTADLHDGLAMRSLAWALLHRYSNLAWYLRRLGEPEGPRSLESLARAWWSLA